MMLRKRTVLNIIDEVMNNREIDSIRNAILAIRDKVIETEEVNPYRIKLRGNNPLQVPEYFDGAKYICVDPYFKIDTGEYGLMWYE